MLDWFLVLDPTVQVAVVGVLGAAGTAVWATVKAFLTPKTEDKKIEYGPKPYILALDEPDRLRWDRLAFILESNVDAIERLRQQIDMLSSIKKMYNR